MEFRWFPVGVWDGRPHVKLGDEGAHVLQFRTQVLRMGNGYQQVGAGDGNTYVVHEYQRPMGYEWSDWQDVPIAAPEKRKA